MGEIRGHPSDASILYINSGQSEISGTPVYLWVYKIAYDGTMTQLQAIQPLAGAITGAYVSGNFVSYGGRIYYVLNSNDAYFTVFDATNPSAPVFATVTNPYFASLSPTIVQNVIQAYIDPSFNIYICNRTTAAAPTLQMLSFATI